MTVTGYIKDPADTTGTGATLLRGFLLKLPLDGSKTGTYGNWTYAAENDFTFSQTFLGNSITGVDVVLFISVVDASFLPCIFLIYSITAHCIPKQIPKKGILFFLL